MRIALLFSSYGPYHLARLRALREVSTVLPLEFSDTDDAYHWDVESEKRQAGVISLSAATSGNGRRRTPIMARLAGELLRFSPDAVAIPGYAKAFALAAVRVCQGLGIPAVLMSDSHAASGPRRIFREALKGQLLMLYQAAFVAGTPHAEYLAQLGFPRDRIAKGYDVVDNRHFSGADLDRHAHETPRRPKETAKPYFFCCARFVEKKNLALLIEAFAQYRAQTRLPPWDLVIAGDGPLFSAILRRVSELALAPHVRLLGRKGYDELPALYGAAGAFVFPSLSDEWGLVVNEAMAAGLPVLVSKTAGCRPDLFVEGVNGYAFDPTNAAELADRMRQMAASADRSDMAQASRRIIRRWDVHRFASGLMTAATIARQSQPATHPRVGTTIAAALSYRM
jgi:glycosyltransferase involved in cell wall biosynthesis